MLSIQGIREKSNVLHDMVSVELAHTLATVCTDTFHDFPCLYLLLTRLWKLEQITWFFFGSDSAAWLQGESNVITC